MPLLTKNSESLDWPTEPLETIVVECAGEGFFQYQALVAAGNDFIFAEDGDSDENENSNGNDDEELVEDSEPAIDLFSLSESQLEDVNFYEVLHLPYRPQLTPDDVKKAYRKACLKYHPDKSGRGEEDAVFLKVQAAFETLSTQKQAYDSTEMPFDDTVPGEAEPDDFFAEYGPVFERNLHFDARLLPQKKKQTSRRKSRQSRISKPPPLGDASTSIDKVHEFYDYWTHFETWRDFGLQAARELETQDHLDQAESRYEKRWYQNQIDKRAKKLKQQEQSRITSLVERAMAHDPRLIQERKRIVKEKEDRQRQREQEALDKKRKEEEAKQAEQRRLEEEKERKAQEKLQREKEKKMLRKTKQVFKRMVKEAMETLQKHEHEIEDEVDLICSELNRDQLIKLNTNLESKTSAMEVFELVKKRAGNLRLSKEEQEAIEAEEAAAAAKKAANAPKAPPTNSKKPFSKEELSALAKGIKKFPPGGANRWDQIAQYINNVCRPEDPRTKEECIETYNQNSKGKPTVKNGTSGAKVAPVTANPSGTDGDDGWTDEQDKQLQEGLSKFPASMDKNERWTSIAQGVPGKTKKQCVARFKTIRDAIKNRK